MCFEELEGLLWVRHMGSAASQAVEAVVDAFPEPVVIEPVLGPHIGEKAGKAVGKEVLAAGELLIGPAGEGLQAGGIGELSRVIGQEVIICDIGQRTGIKAIIGPEKAFSFTGNGMRVGEGVDGPVEGNAVAYGDWVVQLFFPFHKVADQIAYCYVGYAEGQVCMCQIIHKHNVLNFFLVGLTTVRMV